MNSEPWKDWIPGVLSEDQMGRLCDLGHISNVSNPDAAIGSSAIDLYLSDEAYIMEASVKPFGGGYENNVIKKSGLATIYHPNKDGYFDLDRGKTYLFKLKEKLERFNSSEIYGQATAKSTIGRIDVLARLIVDGMNCYEYFNPEGLENGNGEMYLEITPMTFPVVVKEGIALSQLRLFYGKPEDAIIRSDVLFASVLRRDDHQPVNGTLSVDLLETMIGGQRGSAYSAKSNISSLTPLRLWSQEGRLINPKEYWEIKTCDKNKRLKIEKNLFYIMRSKEKISLSPGVAVYCRATDETIGEMRIHYAGFVHPYFGMDKNDKDENGNPRKKPTPLIFEVRGHDIDVSLRDDEKMAVLIFYRMSKDSTQIDDSYTGQGLKLSNYFCDWPE